MISSIRVEIQPFVYREPDGPITRHARLLVRTEAEEYQLNELIPDDDFTRRFDWFLDRAKREITTLIAKHTER